MSGSQLRKKLSGPSAKRHQGGVLSGHDTNQPGTKVMVGLFNFKYLCNTASGTHVDEQFSAQLGCEIALCLTSYIQAAKLNIIIVMHRRARLSRSQ